MYISATRIHNGHQWLPSGTTLEVDKDGTIISILNAAPVDETVFYLGDIVPGFVNAHCHTELSHMKGLLPEHTGLIPFLKSVPFRRNEKSAEEKKEARLAALEEMVANGIVAVGDIANTSDSLDIRSLDKMHFHSFVEALGFSEVNAARSFGFAMQSYEAFEGQEQSHKILRQSITPHAPYSVSPALFRMIDVLERDSIISIHNQESEAESEYYVSKEGQVKELLQALNIDDTLFQPTGQSSLRSYMDWLSVGHPFLFVHNTYTPREDVQFIKTKLRQAFWCLCPNANLYIENRLPDIDMFIQEEVNICIGTDSLASNHQLSILAELYSIKEHYPHINWETMITWATYNGAWALQMQETIGTIAPGKKPGILHITGLEQTAGTPVISRLF